MIHELYQVTGFEIVGPYTLRIEFDDGTAQVIDFSPILYGEMYGPLRNLEFFNQVKLDPGARTLVWPNDADFDPETLRNWYRYREAWIEDAKRWSQHETVTVA